MRNFAPAPPADDSLSGDGSTSGNDPSPSEGPGSVDATAVLQKVNYRIRHLTDYQYSDPVAVCQNQLRMMPRELSSALTHTVVNRTGVEISPQPESMFQHVDYFGNPTISFSIESAHQSLKVLAESEVSVSKIRVADQLPFTTIDDVVSRVVSGDDLHWMPTTEYQFDSPRIVRSASFAQYAQDCLTPDRSLIPFALKLTDKIYEEFQYDPNVTDVSTPTDQAFDLRAGVCQDFAQIEIAVLRSLGLPARYVSGYLRTDPPPGQEKLTGADESHAWVSLYAGDTIGWIDLDPTNGCVAGIDHVPICIGRDYSDVSPMRGVALGGGGAMLSVSVDVEAITN